MSELRVPVVFVIGLEAIREGWEDHVASCAEVDEEPQTYEAWEREWVEGIIEDGTGSYNVRIERTGFGNATAAQIGEQALKP